MPNRTNEFVLGLCLCAGATCAVAQTDDCIRSIPAPMFAAGRNAMPAHRFTQASGQEAVESFRLGADMQVKVEHGGCEYIVTRFRFESPGLFANGYSHAIAYKTAASLLQQLQGLGAESGFHLDLASKTLLNATLKGHKPALNQEFPVQGDGTPPLQAGIVLHAAGRNPSFGYLEVSLFRGPL